MVDTSLDADALENPADPGHHLLVGQACQGPDQVVFTVSQGVAANIDHVGEGPGVHLDADRAGLFQGAPVPALQAKFEDRVEGEAVADSGENRLRHCRVAVRAPEFLEVVMFGEFGG